jgi:acyl-CoA dehydrogenase
MQIFGGMGVSQDTPLAHIFTVSRFCRIADGPDEVHMSQLAKLTIRALGRQ